MKGAGTADRRSEAGWSIVALMATVAIMLIMLGAATPGWHGRPVRRLSVSVPVIWIG